MTTYVLNDAEALNVEFYRGYDPDFLLAQAKTMMFATELWDDFLVFGKERGFELGEKPERARNAMRAHVRFVEYQQFESCFALMLAPFQRLPDWLFLTTYKTKDLLDWAKLLLASDLKSLTNDHVDSIERFLEIALYEGRKPSEANALSSWPRNLEALKRFVRAAADRYVRATAHGGEFNAYKHGLRVLTGHSEVKVGLQQDLSDQTQLAASADSLTFLELQSEAPGRKTVARVVRHFSPEQSLQYLYILRDLADVMTKSRLASLTRATELKLRTFEAVDVSELNKLGRNFEFRMGC